MRLRYVCTALILGGCALAGSAQTGSTRAKVAAGSQMSPVQAQEELLNLFEQEFMGVAQAMSADKYSFAPTTATFAPSQGAKYDGVRTFAQEISHVTTANYYFASKILGEKMPVEPKQRSWPGIALSDANLERLAGDADVPAAAVSIGIRVRRKFLKQQNCLLMPDRDAAEGPPVSYESGGLTFDPLWIKDDQGRAVITGVARDIIHPGEKDVFGPRVVERADS